MRPVKRSDEFRAVQRESSQVAAILRKALISLHVADVTSPVEGGNLEPPSPSGEAGWQLAWAIRPTTFRTRAYWGAAGKVTDRRNSTLPCYFRHCR
jgi:hypothetical protein